ncbi:MAG: methionine--tRNA ligase [Thermoguttaceae bacterium]|nr:methionine--tRNA ligase [Thermoguttaceae bacterium]
MSVRRILVTSALPYANGPIHIGHLVEYIQTDIWVRFQKLRGHRCVYVCADDTHGTAIMISAQRHRMREEDFIALMREAHLRDFGQFLIQFDNYGSTHSEENRQLCWEIWSALRRAGLVYEKEVSQLYDPVVGTFLADRQVRGTCPRCRAPNQYGDNCDKCGAAYSPSELIDPVSSFSGVRPEVRTARHLFVQIEKLHSFLEDWIQNSGALQPEVANYLVNHFLREPLRDWDISRPAPYFGFEIPDAPGNYWYVWFDAPIGYMASTLQWCKRVGEEFDRWWRDPETEIHHFIGKDIVYFHALFWPAMLKTAGFSLPRKLHIHGFLTVNGEKMSKSKGTFVEAATYLKHLDPAYLRFYYGAKLGPGIEDIDLNVDEFVTRVNADYVGNIINLVSRVARLCEGETLPASYPPDGGLFSAGAEQGEAIAEAYESCDYARAMRAILQLCDRANQFLEQAAPWNLRKDPSRREEFLEVCTIGLNLFRQVAVYLAPILPEIAAKTAELLGRPITAWTDAAVPVVGGRVGRYEHWATRVRREQLEAMIADSRQPEEAEPAPAVATGQAHSSTTAKPVATVSSAVPDASTPGAPAQFPNQETGAAKIEEPAFEPILPTISFEEFKKVDLRVAEIVAAEEVEGAVKLLKLTLSLGGDRRRTVFAGIKQAYKPEELIGRLVVVVANLAPRKMRFGVSEGMILAAGPGEDEIFLIGVDKGAKPGQRVQ